MQSGDASHQKRVEALAKLKQAITLLAAGKLELDTAQAKIDQAQQMIDRKCPRAPRTWARTRATCEPCRPGGAGGPRVAGTAGGDASSGVFALTAKAESDNFRVPACGVQT